MRFLLNKYVVITVVLLLVLVGTSRVARADPHAVFYTDRAQEQLFYNVLAALNQSDFVEPAEGDYSRAGLLGERSKVNPKASPSPSPAPVSGDQEPAFFGEQNATITSTRTELSALLSRNITLEGDDLWTAYLVHQFALEVARRNDVDQLMRIYCERGLGIDGCDKNNYESNNRDLIADTKKAFVYDPVEWSAMPTIRGAFGVLLSGLDGYKEEQQELLKQGPKGSDPDMPYLPLAYNESIAQWWDAAENGGSTASSGSGALAAGGDKAELAAAQAVAVMGDQLTPQVNPNIWDYVEIEDDVVQFKGSDDLSGQEKSDEFFAALSTAFSNNMALHAIAESATAEIGTSTTTAEGFKSQYKLVANSGNDGDPKGVSARITQPAPQTRTMAALTLESNENSAQNQKYANPEAKDAPGKVRAVREENRTGDEPQGSENSLNQNPTHLVSTLNEPTAERILLHAAGEDIYNSSSSDAEYLSSLSAEERGYDVASVSNTLDRYGSDIMGSIGGAGPADGLVGNNSGSGSGSSGSGSFGSGSSGGTSGGGSGSFGSGSSGGTSGGGSGNVCQVQEIQNCITIFEQEVPLQEGVRCTLLRMAEDPNQSVPSSYSVSLRECLGEDDTTRLCMRDALAQACTI